MTDTIELELYEWRRGESRPGSLTKLNHYYIDKLLLPLGAVPQRGDVIILHSEQHPDAKAGFVKYEVVEREWVYGGRTKDRQPESLAFLNGWLLVRLIESYSEPILLR